MVLSTFPENMEMTAAAIRITTRRSQNCSANTASTLFFFPSINTFSPFSRRSVSA